jgi:hypothetical protein
VIFFFGEGSFRFCGARGLSFGVFSWWLVFPVVVWCFCLLCAQFRRRRGVFFSIAACSSLSLHSSSPAADVGRTSVLLLGDERCGSQDRSASGVCIENERTD